MVIVGRLHCVRLPEYTVFLESIRSLPIVGLQVLSYQESVKKEEKKKKHPSLASSHSVYNLYLIYAYSHLS